MDCIFCKIINGDIPSYKVYEDEKTLAFLDISQTTFGHTLVVPKKHFKNIYELDEETSAHLFKVTTLLANKLKNNLDIIGLNIVNNNDEPLQSVKHFHIHLIPRYKDDSFDIVYPNNFGKYTQEELIELVNKLNK